MSTTGTQRKTIAPCIIKADMSNNAANYLEKEDQLEDSIKQTSVMGVPVCRFYQSKGFCRYGDRCRYWHEFSNDTVSQDESEDSAATLSARDEASSEGRTPHQHPFPDGKAGTCHFYSQRGGCRNGNRCRFLHDKKKKGGTSRKNDDTILGTITTEEEALSKLSVNQSKSKQHTGICQYFKSGHCRLEERCSFVHSTDEATSAQLYKRGDPVEVPTEPLITKAKIADLSDEDVDKLRQREISQLKKKFIEDKLTALETEDDKDVYKVIINPTDPDWPFDVTDFEFELRFPSTYPLVPFTVTMPEDQVLPNVVLQSITDSVNEWILAKHRTNQIANKVELMVRPFLRWLDRSLERLFTEAAKQFKKVVDAKTAGFEFVSYSQRQEESDDEEKQENNRREFDVPVPVGCMVGREGAPIARPSSPTADLGMGNGRKLTREAPMPPLADEVPQRIDLSNVQRRGTEIKLNGLELSESVSTIVAQVLGVTIQCSRCKNKCDVVMPTRRLISARCGKCHHQQLVTYRPNMVHHFGSTLGYLDLEGCVSFDLILADCVFAIGCLECSEQAQVQGLQFGQGRTLWCEKCHSKMRILVDSVKFQQLLVSQPLVSDKAYVFQVKQLHRQTYPEMHEGQPLPEFGTCKHYKKSFRWLRFPCCGKCYPCDECHRLEETDHEMKYATRMVCGFCCKEQQYTPDKPCISCDSLTTKSRTSHWEGGSGCRNKTKMNRNDKQKYTSTNKTVSRKQQILAENKRAK